MESLATVLIFAGGAVIMVNCFALPIWIVDVHVSGRRSSPLAIPILGPLLLSLGLLFGGMSRWWLLLPWIIDPGTVMFYPAVPRLAVTWWRTSSLTRQSTLKGTHENQRVELTLHSTGYYRLSKTWDRPVGEAGVVGLGEIGRFTRSNGEIELQADNGWSRRLSGGGAEFVVTETGDILEDYSIQNWTLTAE